ncbi:MAG: NAD-dependent epimerase/dehydratase family protein [Pseudomonas sp.]|uniref:NAD-dependent epimerase/dehydratase family protein n=1 Tax=Pseudomonas abieticivorans TaxID=2931382 RepID=UPI0020BF24DB|nr:NAD-dependent epimerase/dehydratase family protein [Pseudomonas sp. PIA16]MDE1167906.1 NAD-dependent epimerase/dehydratase family protein [Pseudomonas sp.]
MHVLITGANGFVGATLVRRLLSDPEALTGWTQLTLLDLAFHQPPQDARVRCLAGSIADTALLADALETPVDIALHLASIPGGAAERDYALGRQVNLDATLALLEGLKAQQRPARVVFASTIAVYGSPLPATVDDHTPLHPQLSYATQKLMGELLIDDFSRRGWIDGISLRLPGIVARPPQPSGLLSAYMSDMFWKLAAGERFDCPVSPQAQAWWMSAARCVDNLLHAAKLPAERLQARRVFALPVLHLSMAQLIDGLCQHLGEDRRALVFYQPNEQLEANFGRYPPLQAQAAQALGLRHDGDLSQLIDRTLRQPLA